MNTDNNNNIMNNTSFVNSSGNRNFRIVNRKPLARRSQSKIVALLLLLFFSSLAWGQTTVSIGDGTSSNYYCPIGTLYNYSITEQLYTASEIGTSGTIQSISFYYASSDTKDFPIEVYMKNVSATDLSTGISFADAELVFSGTYSVNGEGWFTINLDNQFEYDGTSNLLIGINKGYVSWYSGGYWRLSSTSNMARYTWNDNNQYAISTVPETVTDRPDIKLVIIPCQIPAGFSLVADSETSSSADVSWTGSNDSYIVQYANVASATTSTTTENVTILEEGFEGGSLPTGWTNSGDNAWTVGSGDNSASNTHGGSYNAKQTNSSSGSGNTTYLITSALDLSSYSNVKLTCWYMNHSWAGDIDAFGVYYRTSSGGSWTELYSTTSAHSSYAQTDELSLPSDTYVQIGFKFTDNYGYGVALDDILITGDQQVSNTTYDWQTASNNATNPYTIGGLDAGTDYLARIIGVCNGNQTDPSNPITFTTLASASATHISSEAEWNLFCMQVNACNDFHGETVYLDADISPTSNAMVGTQSCPFRGTFNGQGHKITVRIENTTDQGVAPFHYIDGATIKNLEMGGTVTAREHHAAGLVGFCASGSTNVIQNCLVHTKVTNNNPYNGDDGNNYLGGLIGHNLNATTSIIGCVYDGTITSQGFKGGMVGFGDYNSTVTIINSYFGGSYSANGYSNPNFSPVACHGAGRNFNFTFSNFYYNTDAGTFTAPSYEGTVNATYNGSGRAKHAYSVAGDTDVTVAMGSSPVATYTVSGITAYNPGIIYNGTIYGGETETLSLRLGYTGSGIFVGYEADNGTLSGTAVTGTNDAYTIGMPTDNVIISPIVRIPASVPYTYGFEDNAENGQWVKNNDNQTNQWCIGSATNNGGSQSLYISNDGGTSNAYSTGSISYVYAYREINFDATGDYSVSFDWEAYGENSWDLLRAFLIPASVSPNLSAGIANGMNDSYNDAPDTWTDLYQEGGQMQGVTSWLGSSKSISISSTGLYYLVFFWKNDGGGGSNPPAAVDNISIVQCSGSFNIAASANPAGTGTVSGTGNLGMCSTATLTATPASCYRFVNWTEDGEVVSTSSTYSFDVGRERTLVANFAEWTVSVNTSTSCLTWGSSVTLTASTTAPSTPTYTWFCTSGTSGTQSTNTYSVTPEELSNTYIVSATYDGCTKETTKTVTMKPSLTALATPNPLCIGESAELSAETNGSGITWSNSLGTSSPVSVSPVVDATYTVTATTTSGCTSSASVSVPVKPIPQIVVSPDPTSTCLDGSTEMLLTASDDVSSLANYSFTTGEDASKWYNLTSTTNLITSSGDGVASAVQTMPDGFSFPFGGTNYTQFSVNSDGNLRLGSNVTGTGSYSNPFSSSSANNNNPKINGMGFDGYFNISTYSNHVYMEVFGDAPNRVLVVEFLESEFSNNSHVWNWQVQLSENGTVQIVYGSTAPSGCNYSNQIGLCVNASDGLTVNTTSHTVTHFTNGTSATNASSASWPGVNRYYCFTPPAFEWTFTGTQGATTTATITNDTYTVTPAAAINTYTVTNTGTGCSNTETINVLSPATISVTGNGAAETNCGVNLELTANYDSETLTYGWYSDESCTTIVSNTNSYTVTSTIDTENPTYYVIAYRDSITKIFQYTGDEQSFAIPEGTDHVKLEVWGAQGGTYSNDYQGGKGGYSVGLMTVTPGEELKVYVGGQPAMETPSAGSNIDGGFNGGGKGHSTAWSGTTTYAQAGGGATDVRVGGNTLYDRVIVAGGGSGSTNGNSGWAGGGSDGLAYDATYQATQTVAGSGGSFGQGGNSHASVSNYRYCSAGGGGGWYGGGANGNYTDSYANYRQQNGGGSGYVWSSATASNVPDGYNVPSSYYLTDAETIDGDSEMPNPNGGTMIGREGHGFARITCYHSAGGKYCPVKKSVEVTINKPSVSITDLYAQQVCSNADFEQFNINPTITGDGPTYTWELDDVVFTNSSATYTPTAAGTYEVTVSSTLGNCTATATSSATLSYKVPSSDEITAMGGLENGSLLWTGHSTEWDAESNWMQYSSGICTLASTPTDANNVVIGKYSDCVTGTPTLNVNATADVNNLQIASGITVFGENAVNLYGNLVNNGTFNAPVVFAGITTMSGDGETSFRSATINSAKSFTSGNSDISLSGDWTNNGTFTAGNGVLEFAGVSAQTIGGNNATTFKNITFNNANGINIGTEPIVNGTARFTEGIVTGNMRFGTTGLTADANLSSYVDGTVVKNGGGASFTFPTGSDGVLGTITATIASGQSATAKFNHKRVVDAEGAHGFDQEHDGYPRWWNGNDMCDAGDAKFNHISNFEYWDFTTTANLENVTFESQAASADAHFHDQSEYPDPSDGDIIQIAVYDGCWKNIGGHLEMSNSNKTITISEVNATRGATRSGSVITSFGSKSPSVVLPIELLSFTATCDGKSSLVEWSTATERNNDYFVLERSDDAINFNEIARVAGAGNSLEQLDYSYIDYGVHGGDNYYRLVQVDYDGTRTVSEVVVANCTEESEGDPDVMAYPNPFNGELTVVLDNFGDRPAQIEVYDMLGKLVYIEKAASPQNSYETILNLSNLPPAAYTVRVSTADFVINRQVVKN